MNASSRLGSPVLAKQLLQRAGGDDLAVVHRHQPVEALGFVHVGGGDHHAHLRPARADRVDEVPELAARQRIDAGRRLVEDEEVGIVDERAAEAELLLHAAGELAGRTGLELVHGGGGQEFGNAGSALLRALPEQAAEEIDVLEHAQRRIEIAPEALRHVGDAAPDLPEVAPGRRRPCRRRRPRPAESCARLRSARAGSTCRRRPARSRRP